MRGLEIVAVAGVLAIGIGCREVEEIPVTKGPDVLVIGPAYEVNIDGEKVPMFGLDICPTSDADVVGLRGPSPFTSSCLIVKPGDKNVHVLLAIDRKPVHETWSVEWDEKRIRVSLRRPNGKLVVPYRANLKKVENVGSPQHRLRVDSGSLA